MPNWVTTRIELNGDKESVSKLIKSLRGKPYGGETDVDFNKVTRKPKSLDLPESSFKEKYIVSYLETLDKKEVAVILKKYANYHTNRYFGFSNNTLEDMVKEGLTKDDRLRLEQDCVANKEDFISACRSAEPAKVGETYIKNILKYGCSTWYDWSLKYWGTKWNACDAESYDNEDGTGYIEFNTAWSFAEPIVVKLAKKFKSITFNVRYADEDYGYNCGHIIYRDGDLALYDVQGRGDEPRYDLAEAVLGDRAAWFGEE